MGLSSLFAIEDKKVKNWYNLNMKAKIGMETSSPQDPMAWDMQVQEEEQITPQVKSAPWKRIRYDSTCERSKKWKVDPLCQCQCIHTAISDQNYSFAFHTRCPILMSCIPLGHGSTDGRFQFIFFPHDIYLLTSVHTFQVNGSCLNRSQVLGFQSHQVQGFLHGQILVIIANNGQQRHEEVNNDQKSQNVLICKLNEGLTSKLVLR